MIRSELVQSLADANADLARRDVEAAVNAFFDVIAERLAVDGRVELRGFAAFSTRARSPRVGRNLRTGERSEEHTSELQSLMRTSYAVFCSIKKLHRKHTRDQTRHYREH